MFICGSSRRLDDDDMDSWSPCSTPKRSKRSGSYKSKESKNRYSDRGLDKFYALLAELEDKKQKIYTQKGAEDISVVQFVYSNDNEIKPIVVKVKEKKPADADQNVKEKHVRQNSEALDKQTIESPKPGNGVLQQSSLEIEQRPNKKKHYTCNFKLENFRKPSYYLPMVMILILLFLAIFGRSFAILCTSIGWYLIPTIKGESSTSRRPKRKKEYSRRLSEKKIVNDGSSSPRSVISGPIDMSPRKQQHGHKRSW